MSTTRSWAWHPALTQDAVIGVSLAFVGGFVDSAGFVALAGLFTSHVTGNFVLVSDALVASSAGIAKLAALPVFVLAVGAARLCASAFERRKLAPLRPLLAIEALLLLAFIVAGECAADIGLHDSTAALLAGMSAVAAMGVQNAVGRITIAHLPATTVMTVNVAQLTIDAIDAMRRPAPPRDEAARLRLRRLVPAVAAFAAGTVAGAVGASFSVAAVAVPIAVLAALVVSIG